VRAPLWFGLGVVTLGLAAAAITLVVLAGIARAWSWLSRGSLLDVPVWDDAGVVIGVATGAVLVATTCWAIVNGVVGGSHRLLRDVGAAAVSPAARTDPAVRGLANVVEGLAIGLGVPPPELAVIDDPAPNALSARWGRHRVLAVTTGLLAAPRPEVEAVCAHEMAHLHATDSRWISAAEATLGRVRTAGKLVTAIGALVVGLSLKIDILPSVLAFGVALAVVGIVAAAGVGRAQRRIRAESDTVADAAAIRLAGDPGSLADVCARIAADPRAVRRTSWRAEHAWFALVPDDAIDSVSASRVAAGGDPARDPTAAELWRRAEVAYADAGEPFPSR
jgi:Zn-dependent protease with chaperone function